MLNAILLSAALTAAMHAPLGVAAVEETLTVGSKRFTESYILGEILRETAARAGVDAVHRPGLGNTGILFAALRAGSIDLYPEYVGTIAREILDLRGTPSLEALNARLAPMGVAVGVPLGFNNTYALAMREEEAARRGIRAISDLRRHPELKLGLSSEFLARADGWPGLVRAYELPQPPPAGLDHGLAYEAIAAGRIDLMDIYSTDAKIERYGLRVLADDHGFFPSYEAVLLYRLDVPQRLPTAWRALRGLEGRMDAGAMIRMNAAAELEGRTFAQAAAIFFGERGDGARRSFLGTLFGPDLLRLSLQHLLLVGASLALSILAAVPLGVLAAKRPRVGAAILGSVGIIQTIPSLALLAFLIALLGTIGTLPALAALVLYALLPIVRNTHTGLIGIRAGMRQAALALGLTARQQLRSVELPLALPTVLAGIKTAAVINVGTATIAAFIGAGGYGERIVQGLALNDNSLLLAGAIPAAALALAVQGAFDWTERRFGWQARAAMKTRST